MAGAILRNFGVVIPVGNFQNDRSNIEFMVKRNEEYFVETILVFDNQEPADIVEMEYFIQVNHFTNTKLVHGVWNNPGGARNFGLSFCTRDWVSFWDSDDAQLVLNIEKAVNQLLPSDFDAGVCLFEVSDHNCSKLEKIPKMQSVQKSLSIRLLFSPGLWRIIFRRSAITDTAFAELSSAEDQIFLLRFLQIKPRVCQIDLHTYSYVQGGSSQLTKSLLMHSHSIQAIDIGIEELGLLKNNWKQLGQSIVLKLILSVILKGSLSEKSLAFKQFKKLISKIGWIDFMSTFGIVLYLSLTYRGW